MPADRPLHQTNEGVVVHIHVTPGASRSVFPAGVNPWRGCLEAKVRAPASKNQANEELVALLSAFFRLRPQDINIVGGQSSREKTVVLRTLQETTARQYLKDAGHGLPEDP